MPTQEVLTRRHLPHWYVPGAVHFLTYRLAGTIPKNVLDALKAEHELLLKQRPAQGVSVAQHRERSHKRAFGRFDAYLDNNRQIDWLARPAIAALVRENLYHHNGRKYHLLSYCIMPNHVHLLFQPLDGEGRTGAAAGEGDEWLERPDKRSPLSHIMHSLKSYTAHEANKLLGRSGPFWQGESYDHWVRDEDELERILAYICANPIKAGLAQQPQDWPCCSAHERFLQDGDTSGLLDCQFVRP